MTSSPNQTIICQEVFDENSHPSEEEVLEYAIKLGIDPKSEPHLLPIARDGLMHALPAEWKPCFDSSLQRWYYFNSKSGNSQWEHPLDPVYREIVKRGRSEGYSSAGDDDSKTTAKEDLKSFEEVSDMLSSRSNDNLRTSSTKPQDADKIKGSLYTTPQPLLARRKQLQRGGSDSLRPTPMQTAKVVSATMRESNFNELGNSSEWLGSGGLNIKDYKSRSVSNTPDAARQAMQPLRRAHTLDPISDTIKMGIKREDTAPIKGILRDTSFNSLPPRSLARLDPMPGEFGGGISETEDEKKRSVRFADFEFKAMDIKFQISDSEESIYGVEDGEEGSGSSSPIEEPISEGASPDNIVPPNIHKTISSEGVTKVNATPIQNITIHKSSKEDKTSTGPIDQEKKSSENAGKTLFKSPFSGNSLVTQPLFPKSISDVDSTSSSQSENISNLSTEVRNKDNKTCSGNKDLDQSKEIETAFRLENKTTNSSRMSAEIGKKSPWLKQPSNEKLEETSIIEKISVEKVSLDSDKKVSPPNKSFIITETKSDNPPKREQPDHPPAKSNNIRRSISLLEYDLPLNEMEELAKKKASEKLVVFQEKLTKDIQEKITALKQQQNQSIMEAKESIKKEETTAMLKMRQEMEKRMKEFSNSLEEEVNTQEETFRKNNVTAISDVKEKLEIDKEKQILAIRAKYEADLKEQAKAEDKRYEKEKLKLQSEADQRIQQSAAIISEQINQIKTKEESEINELKIKSDQIIDDLKKKYEGNIDDLEEKYKKEIKRIEENHSAALKAIKIDKEAELRRVETEWEDKITASSLQHKATLESAILDHERNIATLRQQFQKDEEELKRKHAEQIEAWNIRVKRVTDKESIDIAQMNRDFEKMRCEKRLLEDKYRSLKDKYVQLKSDMRVAVERKLQSRARRRREEMAGHHSERNDSKTDDVKSPPESILRNGKMHNNNNLDNDNQTEKMFIGESNRSPMPRNLAVHMLREPMPENMTDNDPSSTDDQYNSLSSAHGTESETKSGLGASKEGSGRVKKQTRLKVGRISFQKDVSGNILDNVKSQLQELEEIEERIPSTAHKDTYVRYPFLGPGVGTSAEVDFYRHRVLVEQEAVRAARECLLQQKRELEMRQNLLKSGTNFSTLYQQQQQEKDLTEMEVSIHRTRALLGEKMIRLRLLGQTLDRLVQEPPSPSNTAMPNTVLLPGDEAGSLTAEGGSFNLLQNLENINCEIRDIWTQLNTKQEPVSAPLTAYKERSSVRNNEEGLMSPAPIRKSTKDREAIETRLEELRQWLDKPKQPLNPTWTQLTL